MSVPFLKKKDFQSYGFVKRFLWLHNYRLFLQGDMFREEEMWTGGALFCTIFSYAVESDDDDDFLTPMCHRL